MAGGALVPSVWWFLPVKANKLFFPSSGCCRDWGWGSTSCSGSTAGCWGLAPLPKIGLRAWQRSFFTDENMFLNGKEGTHRGAEAVGMQFLV